MSSSATRSIASRLSSTYRILSSSNCLVFRHNHALITQSLGNPHLSNYTRSRMHDYNIRIRNYSAHSSVQPGAPVPPQPPSSSSRWLLGIVLTIILPFAGNKFGPLLQFKEDVDNAVETIEEVVEVIEKVAEVVEKVAEDISGDLPDGGKLKKVVDVVEIVAEQTGQDAHIVGDAIDKFQELEEKVEEGNKHRKG